MPQVSLRIGTRIYDVSCADGEEAHLEMLGGEVDRRIEELRTQMLGAAEVKLLLAAALTLADDLHTLRAGGTATTPAPKPRERATTPDPADKLASVFEQLVTARVDTIAAKLSAA